MWKKLFMESASIGVGDGCEVASEAKNNIRLMRVPRGKAVFGTFWQ